MNGQFQLEGTFYKKIYLVPACGNFGKNTVISLD